MNIRTSPDRVEVHATYGAYTVETWKRMGICVVGRTKFHAQKCFDLKTARFIAASLAAKEAEL